MSAMHCWVCGEHAEFDRLEVRDSDRGVDEYCLMLCSACSSGGLEHPPPPEALGRHYDASYYGGSDSKFAAPLQSIVNLSTRMRARSIWRSLNRAPAPLVLDIGCGRGSLVAELARLGARGIGLERAALGSFPGHANLELRVGELSEQRFRAASFDGVVLWHAFEHLGNPRAVLAEVGRIMKPGGLLVIAVPNNASWQARFFGRCWFHLDVPRHLHFFGHTGLLLLLRQQGYEAQASSTFDPIQNLFAFVQSCLNSLPGSAPNRFYQLMRGEQAPIGILKMLLWMLPAFLLLPFALVEAGYSAARGDGACSIIFASKKQRTD